MYESFYQLAANPFRLAPDPNFCFSHSGYKRAREYLEYVLEQGEGFVMVTGRPGTGKTMLAETFLDEIDVKQVTAKRITASNYSADDLLRSVAYAYGIEATNIDLATLRHQIQRYLLCQEQAGRRVLLIIDEAQALQHSALEELRILADLQSGSRLMLQLFLIGQESLQDLMRAPEMEQFQQRVIANYHLEPLNLVDSKAYIEFRLIAAGWSGDPDFTGNAVYSIYQLSRGVPRLINKICNRLLLLGYGKGAHTLDVADVAAISTEMRDELLVPVSSVDSDAALPEHHDRQDAMDDLAISSEGLGERLSTIAEATRLATQRREQLEARRRDSLLNEGLQPLDAARPLQPPDAAANGPGQAVIRPEASIQMKDRALLGEVLGIFKWREALMVTGATLALTTISIAALPTIMGGRIHYDELSHIDTAELTTPDTAPAEAAGASTAQNVIVTPARLDAEQVALRTVPEPRSSLNSQVIAPSTAGGVKELDAGSAVARVGSAFASEAKPTGEVAAPEPRSSLDSQVIAPSTTGGVKELDAGPAVAGVGSALATAAKPTDEVEVPGSEQETRTASGEINRQSNDPMQWSDPGQVAAASAPAIPEAGTLDVRIEELLSKGWRSIDGYRLMTPSGDNAYGYFNAVLALDPDNRSAHRGIQEIVDLYAALGRKAMKRRQTGRAARYVDRGLSIQPNNRELLALQSSLEAPPGRPTIVVTAPVVEAPAVRDSAPVSSRTTQEDMVSRITTFFKKRKAEAERGEVITPAGWDG